MTFPFPPAAGASTSRPIALAAPVGAGLGMPDAAVAWAGTAGAGAPSSRDVEAAPSIPGKPAKPCGTPVGALEAALGAPKPGSPPKPEKPGQLAAGAFPKPGEPEKPGKAPAPPCQKGAAIPVFPPAPGPRPGNAPMFPRKGLAPVPKPNVVCEEEGWAGAATLQARGFVPESGPTDGCQLSVYMEPAQYGAQLPSSSNDTGKAAAQPMTPRMEIVECLIVCSVIRHFTWVVFGTR